MNTQPPRAVVLGASIAGVLAAVAFARRGYNVTIIERDELPAHPAPRKGIPQARHAHLLWSGGARTIDALLPGTISRLVDAGAHYISLPTDIVSLSAQGWLRRFPEPRQFLIACSRHLIDQVVRQQALAHHNIEILDDVEGIGLVGNATRITGIRVLRAGRQDTDTIEADFVVDATGRASRTPTWLTELGLPTVREEVVDSGVAYATRVFRAPDAAASRFPVVTVHPKPRASRPGQAAILLPIEDGQWMVTLSGTRGGEPATTEEQFGPFAKSLRHRIIGDLIEAAEPLTPVAGSRSTINKRRRYERLRQWPQGFIVVGDAVATYNPVYGHGMSVAAHSAAALYRELSGHKDHARLTRQLQTAVARAVEPAWAVATSQDILYPGAIGKQPGIAAAAVQRYVERLTLSGTSHQRATSALLDAFSLSKPMAALLAPRVVLAAIAGPNHPPLDHPPLTEDELSSVGMRSTEVRRRTSHP